MFFSDSTARIRAARRVGWASSFALVLLLVQSAMWSDRVPWLLKASVLGVGVFAAVRPAGALLLVTGLVPLGYVLTTRVWNAYRLALAEAWVLAFLAGYLWWHRRETFEATAPDDDLVVPARLFAAVVLASCLVQVAVLQAWHDYPLSYAVHFFSFLTTGYLTMIPDPRPWVDGRGFVSTAALLLEGVALLRCASTLCRRQPSLARKLTNALVAAGVVAAMLSFSDLATFVSSSGQPIRTAIESHRFSSPAVPSIDTAGPYFMMVAFVAIGTAAASRTYLLPGLLAALVSIGAMWLTQTRAALVSALATVAAGVVWWVGARLRWFSPARALLAAAVVAIGVAVGVIVYNPFHVLAAGGNASLHLRVLFARTALRMLASAPVAGVGVGQYESRCFEFAMPELLSLPGTFNAHNYFLWLAAELGPIGLGLFLWLVVAPLSRGWSLLRANQSNYWFLGTFASLIAFIVTWAIGQPLGVPQVAYTFWIMLGLAAGYPLDHARHRAGGHRQALLTRGALAATILLVVASVPIRARRAISEIDLARVSYGFYAWDTTNETPRLIKPAPLRGLFRWTGPRATFFVRSSVRAIDVPLTASLQAVPAGVQVDIEVDRRNARHIILDSGEWQTVRLDAPPSTGPFWRVDLRAAPTWIPRAVVPGSSDERELGVAVGEISASAGQPQS